MSSKTASDLPHGSSPRTGVPRKDGSTYDRAREIYARLGANISKVMQGQAAATRTLLAALASGGHVCSEDFPGTGKTTLARPWPARLTEIQAGPIHAGFAAFGYSGVSVFSQRDQQFHFHEGPIFTNILLADEINRASPRTQSALLEAMGESQVSVDGERRDLEDLFFVIATQNPVEFRGTYPVAGSTDGSFRDAVCARICAAWR